MTNEDEFNTTMEDLEIEIHKVYEFLHPRVRKLALKGKPFVVVAIDEPYFETVYSFIREQELKNGTWNEEDEAIYNYTIGTRIII